MKYDYLIVGAGLFGATFARIKTDEGKKCLVVEKRNHIAGNIYSEIIEGIHVHKYGPHIFHTDKEDVWKFINRFSEFNNFIYSPIANYNGELYNLPFNMNTFTKMWPDVKTPEDARKKISEQVSSLGVINPQNLEEKAKSLVGVDIYEKLIKGYTQKQWGRSCDNLPAFIISRLPVRFTFDNNYFNHPYQGIPKQGYTKMIERMLDGIDVKLNINYLQNKNEFSGIANKLVYTGPIDEYYDYRYGELQYRSLRFETEVLNIPNYQGVAGMNFTDSNHPYTRIVEHKHFMFGEGNAEKTVITREYSAEWEKGREPYYPINDEYNMVLYNKYEALALKEQSVIFGGRLGLYKYMDMDTVIAKAFEAAKQY